MLTPILQRMERLGQARDQRLAALRYFLEQFQWILEEMNETPAENRERVEGLRQIRTELKQEFKDLDRNWPESWTKETRPPDAKERLRQLQAKEEIGAKANTAWAKAIAARTGVIAPTNPSLQYQEPMAIGNPFFEDIGANR